MVTILSIFQSNVCNSVRECATALAALAFAADAVPAPLAAVLLLDNTGRPLACRVRTVRAVLTHDGDGAGTPTARESPPKRRIMSY
jgi:hypothetical protein